MMPPEKDEIVEAEWRGRMNERMESGDRKFKEVKADIKEIREGQGRMEIELAKVKTKVAFWGALGGLGGSAAVGVVVVIATKGLS